MTAKNNDSLQNDKEQKHLKYTQSIMSPLQVNLQQKANELEHLATNFAANKVSAAGISYIVNSRSSVRRTLWFFTVLLCMGIMGYMTINVTMEYLGYPKMMVKEDYVLPNLEFPAVTVCSLNPISENSMSNTPLKKFLALKTILKNSEFRTPNFTERNDCYEKPLCNWSWFNEECTCVDNPCLTEFCLAHNKTHCYCSKSFCRGKNIIRACKLYPNVNTVDTNTQCICKGISTQENVEYGSNITSTSLQEVLNGIKNDDHLREIIRLIKTSQTYDLVDIEEALLPSATELYEYGSTFDNIVASCSYEGSHCHRENFTILYHPNYGKCFMFNYIGTGSSEIEQPIKIHSYGSNSGLQLLLRVTDRSTLDLLRREIGARIVIHNPHALPFVAEYGVNVKPKDMTAVELSLSTIERLGEPWGDCQKETRKLYTGDLYSILGCEKLCNYKHMTKLCKCTMRHLLRGSVLIETEPLHRLCDIGNETERECSIDALEDVEQRSKCNCKPPCKETIYSYSIASSELNVNYFKTVKAVRTLIQNEGKWRYFNYSDEKSMVGVKVYYNTFQVSKHKEIAFYSWETLVANIGGNLGFFMGLTLVTFMEIAEFLWDFIITAFNCKTPKNKIHQFRTGKDSRRIRYHRKRKLENQERRLTF